MKLLFQKDKRTGNILFHDPGYLVPKFQQKELLGIDPSDSDGFSGFTTPENVSSSELKSTSSAQSSPPRPKRTKAKNPEKHVKEMWEMETEEATTKSFSSGGASRSSRRWRRTAPHRPGGAGEPKRREDTTPSSKAPFYQCPSTLGGCLVRADQMSRSRSTERPRSVEEKGA